MHNIIVGFMLSLIGGTLIGISLKTSTKDITLGIVGVALVILGQLILR